MRTFIIRLLPAIILVMSGISTSAQSDDDTPPERLREIKAQKSAFITARLELTPEEAQQFWPIYNEFDDKQASLRKDLRALLKDPANGAGMSEAEAAGLLEKGLQFRQREVDLEKSYAERFKKCIGAVKTLRLRKAEHDFNREVLRKLKDRMQQRGANGDGPGRRP